MLHALEDFQGGPKRTIESACKANKRNGRRCTPGSSWTTNAARQDNGRAQMVWTYGPKGNRKRPAHMQPLLSPGRQTAAQMHKPALQFGVQTLVFSTHRTTEDSNPLQRTLRYIIYEESRALSLLLDRSTGLINARACKVTLMSVHYISSPRTSHKRAKSDQQILGKITLSTTETILTGQNIQGAFYTSSLYFELYILYIAVSLYK